MTTEFSEKLIENCDAYGYPLAGYRATTNLKRAIAYAKNLPNAEAKEALENSLLEAQRQFNRAVTKINDLECPMANNSIATFTMEEYF